MYKVSSTFQHNLIKCGIVLICQSITVAKPLLETLPATYVYKLVYLFIDLYVYSFNLDTPFSIFYTFW